MWTVIAGAAVANFCLFAAMARSCLTYFLWEREQQRKVAPEVVTMTEKTDIEIINDQLYAAFGSAMSKPMDWGRFPPSAGDLADTQIDVTVFASEFHMDLHNFADGVEQLYGASRGA